MPYVERDSAGQVVGKFANPQPGYAEEWLDEQSPDLVWISPESLAVHERAWRDAVLNSVRWLRERHRDEQDIQTSTTLTSEQFVELLGYLQLLRDWPQSPDFPSSEHRPLAPAWIAEQAQ